MKIPGIKTARSFSRWLRARILGGAIIIGYHRVAKAERDEYEICVTPEHFDEQMEGLRKYTHPISLTKLIQHLREGSLPAKSVAVTFDDGYADNLYHAKPVLEKYEVPATVFVCTGFAGREFWWDELGRLIMSSESGLRELRLEIGENRFFGSESKVSGEASLEVRNEFRHALYYFLLAMDVEKRNQAMSVIRSWSNVLPDETPARAMTHDEILQLAKGGLIELGSHTRNHPMLPRLPLGKQREEIESGKKDLEALIGRPPAGFAYPNGRATDDTKKLLKHAGFEFACTSLSDVVRADCDSYELTRFWQRDVNGEKFKQGLDLWMNLSEAKEGTN